jgi:hypothetical protein
MRGREGARTLAADMPLSANGYQQPVAFSRAAWRAVSETAALVLLVAVDDIAVAHRARIVGLALKVAIDPIEVDPYSPAVLERLYVPTNDVATDDIERPVLIQKDVAVDVAAPNRGCATLHDLD